MTAQKHTPGPWFSHVKKEYPGEIQIGAGPIDEDGWPEVNVAASFGGLVEGEQEANARLIAAAPEMLEVLKIVMQHGRIDDSENRMNMVAGVIAKAEGR